MCGGVNTCKYQLQVYFVGMSTSNGIEVTDVQNEDLVRIAGENLEAIFALYTNITIEEHGVIILSTQSGTRITLEKVLSKILQITGVEIRANVINYNPIKLQLLAVIGQINDNRSNTNPLEDANRSNDGDHIDHELLLPKSKISTTKKSATEKIINILQSILRWLRIM